MPRNPQEEIGTDTEQDVVTVDADVGDIEPQPDDYFDPDEAEAVEGLEDDEGVDASFPEEAEDDLGVLDTLDAGDVQIADGAAEGQDRTVKDVAFKEREREMLDSPVFLLDPTVFSAAERRLYELVASGEVLERAQRRIQDAINQGIPGRGFDMEG